MGEWLPAVSEMRPYLWARGCLLSRRYGATYAWLPAVSEIRGYLCGVAAEDTCLARDSRASRRAPTKLCDFASLRETPAHGKLTPSPIPGMALFIFL